jgi:hypothetical protein
MAVSCFGGSNGSATVTPSGGTPGYTIMPAQTGLTAGLKTFTVTDANMCTTTVNVTITQPATALSATAVQAMAVSCFGGSNGSATVTPSGGTPGYTIMPAQTGLTAGLKTFTVTDANMCTTTVNVTITQPASALSATAVQAMAVSCFVGSNGSATVTPSGGTPGYTIMPSQTGLTAGLKTFTVTDANMCTTTVNVTITQPASALSATAVQAMAVSCFGGSNGSATVTPSGGTAPYTITPSQTGLTAGLKTFTVTDANMCTTTVNVTITEPASALSATAVQAMAVSCFGGSNGSATVTPTGGTPPYTITPSQTGLTAGVKTFTVTDANNCTITVSVTINQPNSLNTAGAQVAPVSCFGGNNGSASVIASGGTMPYTISPSQTGLTAGVKTFTVTDANMCTATINVTITQPASAVTATGVQAMAVSCFGGSNGSATVTPTGGTAPYSITPSQTGLTAGLKTFTVTDANMCTTTVNVTITQPNMISVSGAQASPVSCFGGSNGSAIVSASGGTPPYMITPSQTGLTAGLKTFTVTDANMCSVTVNVTITQPNMISVSGAQASPVSCFGGSNGSAIVSASGGTPPYMITPSQTGLTAGLKTFTVTDANMCTTTVNVTITQPTSALMATGVQVNPATCGAANGSASVTPSGGTSPYTIVPSQTGLSGGTTTFTVTDANMCSTTVNVTITQPGTLSATVVQAMAVSCFGGSNGSATVTPSGGTAPYSITPSQTGLTAGLKTFTVTDANMCSVTVSVTITQPNMINVSGAQASPVSCFGGSDGSAIVSASGGTPPYMITPSQTGLTAGLKTFTVTDANMCTATVNVTITQPASALMASGAQASPVSCFGGSNGSATVTPSGGTAPYTITPSQTGLTAGLKTFTVTDANMCSVTVNVTITQPNMISVSGAQASPVSCFGGSNGSAIVSASGGTAPYMITPSQTGLTAGLKTFTVTDANMCTTTVNVTITQPNMISVSGAQASPVSCFGGSDGSAIVSASGGTSPYTILPSQSGLTAGLKTFTVTDANMCTTTVNVTITQPGSALSAAAIQAIAVSCFGGSNGSATVTPSGGTAPYTITPSQTGLTAGLKTFTVTDANMCSATVSVTITQPNMINVSGAQATPVSCFGGSNGSATVTPSGGTAPYTITPSQTGLTAGLKTFTVTDANMCTATVNVTITQPNMISVSGAQASPVSCFGGSNGSAIVSASGGTPPYMITPSQTGLTAGLKTFTVTDANMCTATVNVTITQPASALMATGVQVNPATCGAANGSASVTPSGGTSPYTIVPSQTGLSGGTTTFTVTDANMCSTTVNVTITQPGTLSATVVQAIAVSCFGGSNGSATVTPSGGTAPYTILPSQTGLTAGLKTFTVTDANMCSVTVNVTITQPNMINVSGAQASPVSCFGGSDGSAIVSASGGTPPYMITPSQTGLTAGLKTFTVTDANMCTATVNVTITQPGTLSATVAQAIAVSCFGGSNGSATVTPSGGTAPYTITPSQTGLTAGLKTFTVTDANMCTTTVNVTITQPNMISVSGAQASPVSCFGGSNGSAIVSASGGTPPYMITPSQTGLTAGLKTFTVTDANMCTATVNVTITQPPSALMATGVQAMAVSCFGGSNGSATVTPTGGTAPYSITPSQTGLTAGLKTFTVTDVNMCTTTVNVTITQPNMISVSGAQASPVSCFGGSNGSAIVSASGGTAPYTITPSQTGLTAGLKTFTVTDANMCSVTVSVTITQPNMINVSGAQASPVSCFGGSDGSAIVSASGGAAPYMITPSQTGLTAGLKTFTVTDANMCTATVNVTITQPASALMATGVQASPVSCFGGSNGSATVTPSGGTAPYTITPSQTGLTAGVKTFTVTDARNCITTVNVMITQPPSALMATGVQVSPATCGVANGSASISPSGGTAPYTIVPSQTGLSGGTTTFTVTDANMCTTTVNVTITQPGSLNATAVQTMPVSCFGGTNGSVTVTPSGGTAPYTITPSQTGLTAGLKIFTVTDVNMCSVSVSVTITQPNNINISGAQATPVSCFGGSNGSAIVSVSGGTPSYTILPSQTGLTAGLKTFTVTDANMCSATINVLIAQPSSALSATAVQSMAVSCFGGSNGSATVTPSGGTAPYTITPSQTGLTAGVKTFTVTDANMCTTTVAVTITQPNIINVSGAQASPVSCFGGSNGSASVIASGGTTPYTITPSQTGLTAGVKIFTVTDANMCTATVNVTITQPSSSLNATAAQAMAVSCFGGSNGSVTVTPSGGTFPYTITPSQTGLTVGLKTFTVTDANNCSVAVSVTITQPSTISVSAAQATPVSCFGGRNGSAIVNASGGTPPYMITPSQFGLTEGFKTFTVTDGNSCTATVTVLITQPLSAVSATGVQTMAVSCFGGSNGSATVTPSGGTSPYTIAPAQTGLTAGLKTFTVTDANMCTATVNVTITQPNIFNVSGTQASPVSCFGGSNGSASVIASGGTSPYTIAPAQTGLTAGLKTFTVTDANMCTATVNVTITQPSSTLSSIAIQSMAVSCFGGSNGSATVIPSGGTPPYFITPSQTGLTAGLKTFTVTDANMCNTTVNVTITQPASALSATGVQAMAVSCFGGSNGSATVTPSGGTPPYTITPSQTGLTAGLKTFTVTDANMCITTVNVTITQPVSALSATGVQLTPVSCFGGNDGSATVTPSGGTAPYTIAPSRTGLTAGVKTFTVTDANMCTTTVNVTITQPVSSTLALKVFLEGNYNGTDMSTLLNFYRLLPGQNPGFSPNPAAQFLGIPTPIGQPYNVPPFNHFGTEGNLYGDNAIGAVPYPATVVDWVLVSVRANNTNPTSKIWECAALLHNNGRVEIPSACPCLTLADATNYHVLIQHRNHLAVMSNAIQKSAGVLTMDFTTTQSWKLGIGSPNEAAQKFVFNKYVMLAGNGNQLSGRIDINSADNVIWIGDSGLVFRYRRGDHSLNADVNAADRTLWLPNSGFFNLIQY